MLLCLEFANNILIFPVLEPWLLQLKETDSSFVFIIEGYRLFHRDRICRIRKRGGGICACVKAEIDCVIINPVFSCEDLFEILWLHWQYSDNTYVAAVCYHSPNPAYNVPQFIDNITKGAEAVIPQYPAATLFVLGDFNELDTNF